MEPTLVVRDIDVLLTLDPDGGEGELGRIEHAAIALSDERVCWIGPADEAPDAPVSVDGRGCVALPGLVDCHTHTVWAGSRAGEFEQRLAGAEYSAILEAGGGILSTVRHTRAASEDDLVSLAAARLMAGLAKGVTTCEIKSGYGLSPQAEHKLLVAGRRAASVAGVRVLRTFLGAHTVPAEHRGDRAAYIDQILSEQIPLCAPEADFIDAYVDRGAFSVDEGEQILRAGQEAGLKARIHAEQVEYTGAAAMAARLGALSADHLERIDDDGISAMAEHGTVGVMLPGAMLYLRDPAPPVAKFREAGVPLAVATDRNPGTSPVGDLWACGTLAAVSMRMTVGEVIRGMTSVAADALGRPDLGRLRVGGPADLVLVEPAPGEPCEPASLVQFFGAPKVRAVIAGGALR